MKEGETLAQAKGVQSLSGAEFDRAYMKQMVQDHQETLKLVKDAARGDGKAATGASKAPAAR